MAPIRTNTLAGAHRKDPSEMSFQERLAEITGIAPERKFRRVPYWNRPGYAGAMEATERWLEGLKTSALGRFLREEERARDNLSGVLRRIGELEAKLGRLDDPDSSPADRLTPEMAAASPAQFEKLWKMVKTAMAHQEALTNHVKAWTKWAEEQMTMLDDNFKAVDKNFVRITDHDQFKAETKSKVKALLKQLEQQKGASQKQITELKENITGELESLKASVEKSKAEGQGSAKAEEEVQRLRDKSEEHGEYITNQGAQLKKLREENQAQAALIARQGDKLAEQEKQIADLNAGQKVQDAEHEKLKQLVLSLVAHTGFRGDSQQSPGPGPAPGQQQQQQQQPPQAPQPPQPPQAPQPPHPSHPGPSNQASWPQGNGTWTASSPPPGQGSQPAGDVDMGELEDLIDFDSPMTDASGEPKLPPLQLPGPHQPQPIHPQFHQPPPYQSQLEPQPPQPSTAAAEDIPMGGDEPVVSGNNSNVGFPPTTTPPAQQPVFNSGMPNGNPNSFSFNGTAPDVNKPQINWGPTMGTLSFTPPPELVADDDERPRPATANMLPAPAALASPPHSQPSPTEAAAFGPGAAAFSPGASAFGPGAAQPAPLPTGGRPSSPELGQPAAEWRSPVNNGASPATNVNGGSGSDSPPPVAYTGGRPLSPELGSPPATKVNDGPASDAPSPVENTGWRRPSSPELGAAQRHMLKPKPVQKKKPNIFMEKKKPAASPGKPASVTNKAQTIQTYAASWAQKKQAAFQAGKLPESHQPPPPAPEAVMIADHDESEEWIKGLASRDNPSPFARWQKPTSNKPSTSAYGTSSSPTHDTVESSDPGNIFLRNIVEDPKPEPKPEPQPEPEPEPKPEPTHVHEPQLNPRKHTSQHRAPTVEEEDNAPMDNSRKTLRPRGHASKISTNKVKEMIEDQYVDQAFAMWDFAKASAPPQQPASPSSDASGSRSSPFTSSTKMTSGLVQEHQGGASSSSSQDDSSDDDGEHAKKVMRVTRPDEPRLTAKPRSLMKRMTAGQIEGHREVEAQIVAEEAEDRRLAREAEAKLKQALASQDDEVDYGDPDDVNDEDTHITVMLSPAPAAKKPTKYSVIMFLGWEQYIRSGTRDFAKATLAHVRGLDAEAVTRQWREALDHFDTNMWPLCKLIPWSGYDYDADGYTAIQMTNIMSYWAQEVFISALCKVVEDLRQGPILDESRLDEIHHQILETGKKYLRDHAPDVV